MSYPHGRVAIALNTAPAGGGEQWVHLLPAGKFSGRDGRGPWTVADPAAFIRTTANRQGDALPVDYEHQTNHSQKNGQPAPAAGWIKELEPRSDGIWGRIEWTARAAAHIADKEFRYISPVFAYRPDNGDVVALLNAGLTNTPNLELTALSRAENGDPMDELTELRTLLNLNGSAQLAEVVGSVRELVTARAANRPDPAKFVPMDVFQRITGELNARNQGVSSELAERHVSEQIASGKLVPFLKDWGLALCSTNKPAFDEFVAKTSPGLQTLFEPSKLAGQPPGAKSKLSETDAQIAKHLGHSEEEFIAANRSRTS